MSSFIGKYQSHQVFQSNMFKKLIPRDGLPFYLHKIRFNSRLCGKNSCLKVNRRYASSTTSASKADSNLTEIEILIGRVKEQFKKDLPDFGKMYHTVRYGKRKGHINEGVFRVYLLWSIFRFTAGCILILEIYDKSEHSLVVKERILRKQSFLHPLVPAHRKYFYDEITGEMRDAREARKIFYEEEMRKKIKLVEDEKRGIQTKKLSSGYWERWQQPNVSYFQKLLPLCYESFNLRYIRMNKNAFAFDLRVSLGELRIEIRNELLNLFLIGTEIYEKIIAEIVSELDIDISIPIENVDDTELSGDFSLITTAKLLVNDLRRICVWNEVAHSYYDPIVKNMKKNYRYYITDTIDEGMYRFADWMLELRGEEYERDITIYAEEDDERVIDELDSEIGFDELSEFEKHKSQVMKFNMKKHPK